MVGEAIYKGATRPAMLFGIPLVPLVALCGAGLLLMLWGGLLVSWGLAVALLLALLPLLGWMRFATRRDDQRFHQLFIAAKLQLPQRNRRLWQGRSYAAICYRGTDHR